MIEEPTLSDTVRRVQEVPPEQRRIIVYTGVHPHEDTSELTKPHEERWSENGVLVVAHPKNNTPHAIWKKHKKLCADGEFRPLDYSVSIDETSVEDAISGGEPTLFIRFHGTEIIPNLIANSLDPKKVQPRYLERRMDPVLFEVKGHIHEQAFEEWKKNHDLKDWKEYPLPTDRILLEYNYLGEEFASDDPFIGVIMQMYRERYPNGVRKVFHEDDLDGHGIFGTKTGMSPRYLVQNTLSDDDIRDFHENHVKLLDNLIAQFSRFYK
jgi:hypothetical protein